MRKFKVICLNVGGHSNKIYYHGEIVREDQFLPGQADAYAKTKHIEEVDFVPAEEAPAAAADIPNTDDVPEVHTEAKAEQAPAKKKKK